MEQQNLFKGRDKRRKGWFWMDNDYLNGWAKSFGAVGTAIYVSLCRHADNETQKCFPAQKLIAEELNISERVVRNYLASFRKSNLISVERERDPRTKKWLNNVYTLLDKEHWQKPEAPSSSGVARGTRRHEPEAPSSSTLLRKTHIKETHLAKLRFANLNPLIELFKEVNPTYERLYSNKTQRAALERLVGKFGEEKVANAIKSLSKVINKPYAPKITTPIVLEKRLGDLVAFVKQEASKGESKKAVFIK